MNIVQKLKITINDAMRVDGDLIDFRISQGTIFCHLVAAAIQNKRIAYGIDTFTGLPPCTKEDLDNFVYKNHQGQYSCTMEFAINNVKRLTRTDNNYKIIKGSIPEALLQLPVDAKFNFALLDLLQYKPTSDALEYLWHHMNFAGTIFIFNYNKLSENSADLAITEFLKKHEDYIICNEQMIVNGIKEDYLIIKCFNETKKPINYEMFIPSSRKLTIAMTLRTGGAVYDATYVNNLAASIRRNSTEDVEIVCLTDNPTGFSNNIDRVVKFKHNYPKWWGKIELFRNDIFDSNRVLYFDLDTVIINNIDELINFEVEFSGLRDFYHMHTLGSGVMAWFSEKMTHIYENFKNRAGEIMGSYIQGDQKWIDENKPSIVFLQDMFPHKLVSFKKDCFRSGKIEIPKKASVICFHGNPRPHTITDALIKNHWKS